MYLTKNCLSPLVGHQGWTAQKTCQKTQVLAKNIFESSIEDKEAPTKKTRKIPNFLGFIKVTSNPVAVVTLLHSNAIWIVDDGWTVTLRYYQVGPVFHQLWKVGFLITPNYFGVK